MCRFSTSTVVNQSKCAFIIKHVTDCVRPLKEVTVCPGVVHVGAWAVLQAVVVSWSTDHFLQKTLVTNLKLGFYEWRLFPLRAVATQNWTEINLWQKNTNQCWDELSNRGLKWMRSWTRSYKLTRYTHCFLTDMSLVMTDRTVMELLVIFYMYN